MKDWFREQWTDIKGNLKYDLIKWSFWFSVGATSATGIVQKIRQMPIDWILLLVVFAASFTMATILVVTERRRQQAFVPELQAITINAREIYEPRAVKILEALQPCSTSDLAIFSLQCDAERRHYADSLEKVFQRAGWHVIRREIQKFESDEKGLLLVRHSDPDTPDISAIKNAFQSAEMRFKEVHVGPPKRAVFYKGFSKVNTRTPVIFVGSDERY